MAKRLCLEPQCTTLTPATRCPTHARQHETARTRARRAVRPYSSAERVRRRDYLDQWVAVHGPLCVGWDTQPAHHVQRGQLTADHIAPVSAGGPEDGPLQALCRSCNARKATKASANADADASATR